jgi:hypothetical protein
MTACAFAAVPFVYWTGGMKFRFQIAASAFHKGRIKIVYEPNSIATNEYNTNYTKIIDIAETQDFTMEVGLGQDRTLLTHADPCATGELYATTALPQATHGNGVLSVYVVNTLTSPSSDEANIFVNTFVSMCDDFEVFVPTDNFQKWVPYQSYEAQSGPEMVPDAIGTDEPDAPQQMESIDIGPTTSNNYQINAVFTGEAVTSFRQLIKRYTIWRADGFRDSGGSGTNINGYNRAGYPFYRGADLAGVDATTTGPYNYVNTLMLHWIVLAHQGYRGSVRYKNFFRNMGGSTASNNTVRVTRLNKLATPYGKALGNLPQGQVGAVRSVVYAATSSPSVIRTGATGCLYNDLGFNSTVEYEWPFYSQNRFVPGKRSNYVSQEYEPGGYNIQYTGNATTTTIMETHVAAGEDFQVYFWTGLPKMWCEPNPPVNTPG